MFKNNLTYEFKLLLRSNWLVVILISMILLVGFASFNGHKNVSKRRNDIAKMQQQLHKKDSAMLNILTKVERGEKVGISARSLPTSPMNIGYRHPRLAIMHPASLSFISTGQSDMYTHFKSPTVYGNNFALDYAEMVNPVQLLFGNFDLTFVLIFIIPLLIIAFTYNMLSKEKELGTLRLLGAQPISLKTWLLQKMSIRYGIFTLITLLTVLSSIAITSFPALSNAAHLAGLLFMIAGYNLFWFALAFLINLKINDSSKNAFTLVGIWLFIVLIFPATINQIGNTLHPTPSRLKMINEIRLIKKENEEKQNEIMSDYLRTHPELSAENTTENFGFWHNYFASEKVMEDKTKPLLAAYEMQLEKQQELIGVFKYSSPTILLQQSLNAIAGTSENHYNDYKKQVFEFSNDWRNYLVPMLFKNEKFSLKSYENLPQFVYKNRIESSLGVHVLAIFMLSALLLLFSLNASLKET